MTGLHIRSLRPEHSEAWLDLWQGYLAFYNVSCLDPAITERNWAVMLAGEGPLHALLAVDENEVPVALMHYLLHPYTWGLGDACYLEDLYVSDKARGKGAGRALIDHLIALGREKGWTRLYWNTQQGNARARALYDSYTKVNDFVQYKLQL